MSLVPLTITWKVEFSPIYSLRAYPPKQTLGKKANKNEIQKKTEDIKL